MMEQHYLTDLFEPKSVAVIGASDTPGRLGGLIFSNLRKAGYTGACYPVNPRHKTIQGERAWPTVDAIDGRIDLAVITTRPTTIPEIIDQCGRAGVKAVIIIAGGFGESGHPGAALERKVLEAAQNHGIRVLGPNSLGIIRPELGLNATFAEIEASPGNIALVSQSGALCTAMLDWAKANEVGFSSVVSLGGSADVDFGEVLDYLVYDNRTHAILLYIEGIRDARRFMSALRSAARIKPIILLKVGRHASGLEAARMHSNVPQGADDVFDAAVRRAGVVRVQQIYQLIYAAKALSTRFAPKGNRLAIVTNGGGMGVMAADRASDLGIPLAALTPATLKHLDSKLARNWNHANPIDLLGDATPEHYREAVSACVVDENVDGVLVVLAPQSPGHSLAAAQAVVDIANQHRKPVLTSWMGEASIGDSRHLFTRSGIPTFRTPEPAVELFSHLSAYYRNQQLLLQAPGPVAQLSQPEVEGAVMLVEAILAERRKVLSEMESKSILRAFRIPVAQTMIARSPTESLLLAEQIGLPVAMKIDSPDVKHKSDLGGVRLNVQTAAAVRNAYTDIIETVHKHRPKASINGISIEPYVARPHGRELSVGVVRDPVFGPVITLSAGGTSINTLTERAVALPPLNRYLARDLIQSSRVRRLLEPYRDMPAANLEAIEIILRRVSDLVCELPWVEELEINPLIVDEEGAIAADARIVLRHMSAGGDRYAHMAIHPYPTHLVSRWELPDGDCITIRPIRPEDAEMEKRFMKAMSDESRYFRFMDSVRELSPTMLVRFTQIDYDREMALVAVSESHEENDTQIGVARYTANPDGESCEFALAIADAWQKRGVGRRLMTALIDVARNKGYRRIIGEVLSGNSKMLGLMSSLGFTLLPHPEDAQIKRVIKPLQQ